MTPTQAPALKGTLLKKRDFVPINPWRSRFFIVDFVASTLTYSEESGSQPRGSLRLGPGVNVIVGDAGKGGFYPFDVIAPASSAMSDTDGSGTPVSLASSVSSLPPSGSAKSSAPVVYKLAATRSAAERTQWVDAIRSCCQKRPTVSVLPATPTTPARTMSSAAVATPQGLSSAPRRVSGASTTVPDMPSPLPPMPQRLGFSASSSFSSLKLPATPERSSALAHATVAPPGVPTPVTLGSIEMLAPPSFVDVDGDGRSQGAASASQTPSASASQTPSVSAVLQSEMRLGVPTDSAVPAASIEISAVAKTPSRAAKDTAQPGGENPANAEAPVVISPGDGGRLLAPESHANATREAPRLVQHGTALASAGVNSTLSRLAWAPPPPPPPPYASLLEAKVAELKALARSDEGWRHTGSGAGGTACYAPTDGTPGCKGIGFIPFPRKAVSFVLSDLGFKARTDPQFHSGSVLHSFDEHTSVVYWRFYGKPMVAGRDFANLSHWRVETDGTLIHVAWSIPWPGTPAPEGIVRARAIIGGWIMRPRFSGSKTSGSVSGPHHERQDEVGCDTTWCMRSDFAGSIPAFITRQVAAQQAGLVGVTAAQMAKDFSPGGPYGPAKLADLRAISMCNTVAAPAASSLDVAAPLLLSSNSADSGVTAPPSSAPTRPIVTAAPLERGLSSATHSGSVQETVSSDLAKEPASSASTKTAGAVVTSALDVDDVASVASLSSSNTRGTRKRHKETSDKQNDRGVSQPVPVPVLRQAQSAINPDPSDVMTALVVAIILTALAWAEMVYRSIIA